MLAAGAVRVVIDLARVLVIDDCLGPVRGPRLLETFDERHTRSRIAAKFRRVDDEMVAGALAIAGKVADVVATIVEVAKQEAIGAASAIQEADRLGGFKVLIGINGSQSALDAIREGL